MKILANRKIKFLFCSILSCILVFVLISTVLVNLDVRNTVYYIIFCSVCMGAAILLFCYGYFKEQHKIMENAISQITEYISGNKEVTIECNDEGELYRLFHEVNSLVAILNAHAENEKSAKKFLRGFLIHRSMNRSAKDTACCSQYLQWYYTGRSKGTADHTRI